MFPATLSTWAGARGLSASALARLAGVAGPRTVRRWYSGEREIPGTLVQLIRLLDSLPPKQAAAAIARLQEASP